jgi:hypothetical protein
MITHRLTKVRRKIPIYVVERKDMSRRPIGRRPMILRKDKKS